MEKVWDVVRFRSMDTTNLFCGLPIFLRRQQFIGGGGRGGRRALNRRGGAL